MRDNITAKWANERAKDIKKFDKFLLKKCLKKIKKSANNKNSSCKIEYELTDNIINEIKKRGFSIKYNEFFSTAFPIHYTILAHYIITW